MNKKRFEPSLIRNYNYLYCFDASKKNGEKFSFEKFNLNKLSESSWEIIYPNISPKLGNNVYNQKFFGITEDNKHNIIFLGGLYDNNSIRQYLISNIIYYQIQWNYQIFLLKKQI